MNLHRSALQKSEHIYIALICTNVHWSASMYTDLHRYAVIHTDRHGGDGCIDGCNVWDILSTFLMRFQILLSPKSTQRRRCLWITCRNFKFCWWKANDHASSQSFVHLIPVDLVEDQSTNEDQHPKASDKCSLEPLATKVISIGFSICQEVYEKCSANF